jgi:hypothetical protein
MKASSRTQQFPLREHSCALANYGFAAIFAALNLPDYGTWSKLKAMDNAMAH